MYSERVWRCEYGPCFIHIMMWITSQISIIRFERDEVFIRRQQ